MSPREWWSLLPTYSTREVPLPRYYWTVWNKVLYVPYLITNSEEGAKKNRWTAHA